MHLTVRLTTACLSGTAGESAAERLRGWAGANGAKFTHIVLDRGGEPSRPMLTLAGRGTLTEQRATADGTARRLRAAGFEVARVKIEAAPWNADVPGTARAAAALPGCYFEHHAKVLVTGGPPALARLAELAVPHAAHVSRNARRHRDDGAHERFVTQRCRGFGLPEARGRFDALLAGLAGGGFAVLESEQEFVVHDDNPAIDDGWIEER
ncbi:hypothetical protein HII36_31085 [Nonomuraea sp. NN258]|nr:hypothetical protein [Nonomuraea antri]